MMGTPRFLVVYFASGLFGFILGANFALVGLPSVGASGAIFGTHAALLVCVARSGLVRVPRACRAPTDFLLATTAQGPPRALED